MSTPTQIASHFVAMNKSITLINECIDDGDKDTNTLSCVKRNVEHLEAMLLRDFWTTEDMSDVNAAITAGKAYIA